jgi:hypothetical protein
MKLLNRIVERFPDRQNIRNVFAVIVTLVYSWTLFTSFYKLPSWMFYLNSKEIASVYAYFFVFDFLDSVLLLAVVLFLEMTLFLFVGKRDGFQARSMMVVLVLLGFSMARLALFQDYEDIGTFLSSELPWAGLTALIGIPLALVVPGIRWLGRALDEFADRAVILMFIYIPLSFISFIVVLFRNLN